MVDDESGDVEGNIMMAASLTSQRDIAFMMKHGSGIVSVGMKEEDLERLKLPLMSDEDSSAPAFTITVVMFCNSQKSFTYQRKKKSYIIVFEQLIVLLILKWVLV